eukprot:CAMPEP_0170596080 /NCGR_PEP_ID=MMETSP0224-20130122/14914_1 /TAXON_ID=285029 /ORGANISM="Togula jolla, Strain CCCM 725" /LENGTH=40 /DNA_ID= /DNA_START= /DNA_END= /DNA_ORIENTATION=
MARAATFALAGVTLVLATIALPAISGAFVQGPLPRVEQPR